MKVSVPAWPVEDVFTLGFNFKLKLFVEDADRMTMNAAHASDDVPEASLLAPAHA